MASPFRAFALEAKVPRVAIFEPTTAEKYQTRERVFVDTLRELGWIEGRNIEFDRVFGNDDVRRLPVLATSLVKRVPDVIYTTSGGSSNAAVAATRTIPIVLGSQSDLVERGWVQSLAHPGGNVTGIVNLGPDLGPKRLQLLKQALPKVTRVGLLVTPLFGGGAREMKMIEQLAKDLRIAVVSTPVNQQADELDAAFAALTKGRIEALLIAHSWYFLSVRKQILEFASQLRIPVVAHRSEMTDSGALMSYSSIFSEQVRRAAHLVDKILKGEKPADIPVELPTRFELVINRRTANALGIRIPGEIMLQAARVIE